MVVYIGIGTNEGDRQRNMERALESLDSRIGGERLALSDIVETQAWGFDGPDFLNAVVAYKLENPDPEKILLLCKEIEREMGRDEVPEYDKKGNRIYHSRVIDLDILEIGDMEIHSARLTVPHPLIEKRDFVKIPLKQLKNKLNN